AAGDAEAKLAEMNQQGIVDAVLTTDSDSFALGTLWIITIATYVYKNNSLQIKLMCILQGGLYRDSIDGQYL
ncbi:hypothetical protein C8R42DRAFT_587263, partial [Lentinula raphanica]